MGIGSIVISVLLHSSLALLAIMWPGSSSVNLGQAVKISLVEGAPGGDMMPSPVLGHLGSPAERQRSESSRPRAEPITPLPSDSISIPKTPEPRPSNAVPDPPKAVSSAPKPENIPAPKQKPVEPEKKEEQKKTSPVDNKKTDTKSREDALKSALADARKSAQKERSSAESRRQAALASAMADMRRQSSKEGNGGGGGGEGDGPGGGGIYDVYTGLVILAIQPHWSMTTFSSRENISVAVRIKLDRQGNVLDCHVERPSGNAAYDASAVNAVYRAKILPPPPGPEQQDLLITFNAQDMAGR